MLKSLASLSQPSAGNRLLVADFLHCAEEAYPEAPRLLPKDILGRARVRAIASFVVADIQPLQNTGLDWYFEKEVGLPQIPDSPQTQLCMIAAPVSIA